MLPAFLIAGPLSYLVLSSHMSKKCACVKTYSFSVVFSIIFF